METTMHEGDIPVRVRVLVLGGGIHGAGVLHDMATRGWKDIHLLEKDRLGAGTSAKSTKLIHGGLRYLRNLRDFGLVMEALRERRLLMDLAPDLIKPIELLFPVLNQGGMPRAMIKTGLSLYDRLAGRLGLDPHHLVEGSAIDEKAPPLNPELFRAVYSFSDGQTDDRALVRRVAASAVGHGASLTENARACAIRQTSDGFEVDVEAVDGSRRTISALYVINCLGPWANRFLEQSNVTPPYRGLNNKGVHLVFSDLGLKAGLFLQSPEDGRIFFMLPWQGYTLVGTTEELFEGSPDEVQVNAEDVEYLLDRCNRYMRTPLTENGIIKVFAGLRWLAAGQGRSLTSTSRSALVGETKAGRGLLLTLYGGKLTTYRRLAKSIGDRLTTHFGEFTPSRTHKPSQWARAEDVTSDEDGVLERFATYDRENDDEAGRGQA